MNIALLSDIHSNIFALEAIYKDFENKDVEKILICGDIIGYYYWPKDVIKVLMSDKRISCISGNHEIMLKESIESKEKNIKYKKKYGSGYDFCINQLSDDELNWLLSLPKSLSLEINGISFSLAHGSLKSHTEYLYPDSKPELLNNNYSDSDFTVLGHTHYPFVRSYNNKLLINPGSVGQPRDYGGSASYALVNSENLSVIFRRVRFQVKDIIRASKENDPNIEYLQSVMLR